MHSLNYVELSTCYNHFQNCMNFLKSDLQISKLDLIYLKDQG
ncbi:21770_t:CDS:2 [Gigaspora margarita]|uniref:21770_t:CDS:1 n=1 Tax=Gigaspora margarita TaxID=4874 RepID=A0ABM8W3S0_GIGMA|nr:21770_t:CDS:2 [Gigaspora margarita]